MGLVGTRCRKLAHGEEVCAQVTAKQSAFLAQLEARGLLVAGLLTDRRWTDHSLVDLGTAGSRGMLTRFVDVESAQAPVVDVERGFLPGR